MGLTLLHAFETILIDHNKNNHKQGCEITNNQLIELTKVEFPKVVALQSKVVVPAKDVHRIVVANRAVSVPFTDFDVRSGNDFSPLMRF
jgi:hypothetical protein